MVTKFNNFLKNNVHLSNWVAIPISIIALLISFNANSNSVESKNVSTIAQDKAQKAEIKAKQAYDKATQEDDYYDNMSTLGIKLYTMKKPDVMKPKLEKALNEYPDRVLPYVNFYDFYIKTDDQRSALIMLNRCIENAKPITQLEYQKLVELLYENNIRSDLQKKYIQEAYLKRTSDYSTKKHIEDLYSKIIKDN